MIISRKEKDKELRELVTRYQKFNDEKAFDKLYKHFERHIHKIINKYSYDHNELLSEANHRFIVAVQNFQANREASVTTYIYKTIDMYCRNYLRRYASLFGKRSGDGNPGGVYYESLDTGNGEFVNERPSDDLGVGHVEREIVEQQVIQCIENTLSWDEQEVIKHFFGIDDKDEPTYSNTLKRREDEPYYSSKDKKWIADSVSDDIKIKRIARITKRSRDEVEKLFKTAIIKLREEPAVVETLSGYAISNDNNFYVQ